MTDSADKTLGALADELYAKIGEIGKLNAKVSAAQAEKSAIESQLIGMLEAEGVDGVRGKTASVSIAKKIRPQIADYEALVKYILRHKLVQLFERRISSAAYKEIVEKSKKPIPGVSEFEQTTLNVRKV